LTNFVCKAFVTLTSTTRWYPVVFSTHYQLLQY